MYRDITHQNLTKKRINNQKFYECQYIQPRFILKLITNDWTKIKYIKKKEK